MLHADVAPEPWWLDKLITEAEKHEADLMAAVVPMKDMNGFTSTAIARAGASRIFCRLMMHQVRHPLFPDTFNIDLAASALENLPDPFRVNAVPREALLVNTGCFVCRFDGPWCERVWFSIEDGIGKTGELWQATSLSEDWVFSRRVAEQGAKVMATRLISLAHKGPIDFHSHTPWGKPRDDANLA